MKIFTTKIQVRQYAQQLHADGKRIGFVPTMGALHLGHLSLIEQARSQCDIVISSIFVNPTQFTDPKDLDRYPRPIEADIDKLEKAGCDALFNPKVSEMYAGNEKWHLDIGELEYLLEGASRPGHYQGVMQVVNKLFDIVQPDVAFFGQKDYQQFLVISKMVELLNIPVNLVMCPIERETDGLAMSSRNVHLSPDDYRHALVLSRTLQHVKNNFNRNNMPFLKAEAFKALSEEPGVKADYFEFADGDTLLPANQNSPTIVALVAAKVGNTRLIDNMIVSR
ncbi:pantoate--beta-alanine ligase [Mucilaginibacter limnophilus]|uniref:Pantothenate synthetase n=1 Tax=Mucilaginibacter limnophilus TaxID=1932778 RepID=A0A437MUZ3_9SPHI|nr:pantoate--beta-alanine ligase [Mucilaginibacter limnophilus]RVU01490.1 pantoate--beta-alanine ligase [Mucilaginibacter limnophilus]